ncbi:hypothetical protein [Carnobacterium maltaromaticum]|uniref:hypothetical protein n=1 Tax=Carnobacterium maltaromaticum TaxID=2751 RepID=UPI00054D69BF|nr:hypothetical protein [Carnobacterium maltaromaticum]KRN59872.1 hypothetical protein IV70_GL001367 [Carnobacterium maltaromaticum DSM 20342]
MMDVLNNILTFTGIIGSIYGVGSWLYYHKITFYLKLNKILSFRREINFDLMTSFEKNQTLDFKKIEEIFKENGYQYQKVQNLKNSKIYNLGSFLFEIKQIDSIEEDDKNVSMGVINAAVTYKTALKIISDYEKIAKSIFVNENILSAETQSSLTLKYGKNNPFMGRNLANLEKNSIKYFSCQVSFNEIIGNDDPTTEGNDVFIYKESINYTTNDLPSLVNIAKICFNTYK